MPFGTHQTDSDTATRSRLTIPASLRGPLLGAVALLVLILIVSGAVKGRGKQETPAVTPAPAATAKPVKTASPQPEETPPPEERPSGSSTSGEMAARAAIRRDGFPMLRWDVARFSLDSRGRMLYAGAEKTLTGIDISEHQYDVDWKKVAADGVDFAMIRMGYRGSTAGGLYEDEYFEKNMAGANKAGVPVGVYFYSQAVTVAEAEEEADYLLERLRDYKVSMPVVFDWEIVGGSDARTYSVTRQTLRDCARAFCEKVKAEGYEPMIYFTQYLGYRKYILRELSDYGFWYAEYAHQPRIAFDFDMWQYSETGQVDGIDGEVDMNIYFVRE